LRFSCNRINREIVCLVIAIYSCAPNSQTALFILRDLINRIVATIGKINLMDNKAFYNGPASIDAVDTLYFVRSLYEIARLYEMHAKFPVKVSAFCI